MQRMPALRRDQERIAMPLLARITRDGATPDILRPDPAKVVHGDPVHTTWNVEDRKGLSAGLWQSTPGAWRVSYAEWEYFHVLEGVSVLTDAAGHRTDLRAGDSYVIRPGFAGIWEVLETTLKTYVILD